MAEIHYREQISLDQYDIYWPNGICIHGMRSILVGADGTFYPCEKFNDLSNLCIGNVY